MISHKEHRESLLADIVRAYRTIRRVERTLAKPMYVKRFKNQKCKRAVKASEQRELLEEDAAYAEADLKKAWGSLPEVRQTGGALDYQAALVFAKSLTKRPRTVRYLRNQLSIFSFGR